MTALNVNKVRSLKYPQMTAKVSTKYDSINKVTATSVHIKL